MKKALLCFLVILMVHISLNIPVLRAQGKVSYLQSIKFQDALPAGSISGIIQDNYGFLWFASWTGLYRYDGNGIVNVTQKLKDQMGRKISCIYNSSDNHLWIGTFSEGLFVMDNTTNQLTKIDTVAGRRLGNIYAIAEDRDKQIFVGMQEGLMKYDLKTQKHSLYPLSYQDVKDKVTCVITAFSQDKNGTYWVGTHLGLFTFDGKTGRFTRVSPSINSYVYQILCDGNKLWIVTKNGFYSIDNSNKQNPVTLKHRLEGENDLCMSVQISKQDRSKLWVGAYTGMYLIDKKDLDASHTSGFQKKYDLQVGAFLEDRTNILWIATEKGIYKADFYQKRFHVVKDPESLKNVLSVASDGKDRLWLGTWGKGLFSLSVDQKGEFSNINKVVFDQRGEKSAFNAIIYSLKYARDGALWVATRGAGIYRLLFDAGGKLKECKSYSTAGNVGIPDDYIMYVTEDEEGNVWAGSWDGFLLRYDKQKDCFVKISYFSDNEKAHHFPVNKIIREKKGSLLLGTGGNGLVRLWLNDSKTGCKDVEHFAVPLEPKSLRWYFILDMLQLSDGSLFVCTEGGIARFDTEKRISYIYGEAEGLPPAVMNCVVEDQQNKVWLSSESGVFKLEFDGVKLKTIRSFTVHDGLQSNSFNQRSVASIDRKAFVFGGEDGFCMLSPSAIYDASVSTKVVLTDFKLFNQTIESGVAYNGKVVLNQSISSAQSIDLEHDENTFSIGFSALNYSAPQKIKYAYKLSGINNTWVTVDASYPYASFTKLKYGTYRFQVKCTNSDGVWSENETELVITIHPPWWKGRIATIVYFMMILLLLYFARYMLEFKHRLEMKQFEYKKNLEVYDSQLKFFTNISHEFRTPLTVIIGLTGLLKSKEISKKGLEENINGIDRNAKIMKRLVDDLMDLRKMEKDTLNLRLEQVEAAQYIRGLCENFNSLFAQKKVAFTFTSEVLPNVHVKVDKLRFESVIYNLLSNAFKFTPEDGAVTCILAMEERSIVKGLRQIPLLIKNNREKYLVIHVADNGTGISKADLPRIFDIYYSGTTYQKGLTNTIGTGIGLPFTKKIVELHRGFIEVTSEENKGSEFRVYIPVSEEVLKPVTEIIQAEASAKPKPEVVLDEEAFASTESNEWSGDDERHSKYLILVVDDNDDLREMVKSILPSHYRVIEAADGLEGYELAKKDVPDLIITDVLMPRMTGTELCEKLKQTEITNHIPIIMLTALPTIEDRIEGLRKGADSYIPKPFDPGHLLVRIEKLIETREKLKSRFMRSYIVQPTLTVEEENYDPSVEFLNKVRASVDKNISNPDYSVGDLCVDIGMSRMQLFRKLKATTDISANKIIRMMRLEKAKKLLLRGDLNVADVTYSVGFNDLQYFRKCFKEEFGITPSDYVRQQKK